MFPVVRGRKVFVGVVAIDEESVLRENAIFFAAILQATISGIGVGQQDGIIIFSPCKIFPGVVHQAETLDK